MDNPLKPVRQHIRADERPLRRATAVRRRTVGRGAPRRRGAPIPARSTLDIGAAGRRMAAMGLWQPPVVFLSFVP